MGWTDAPPQAVIDAVLPRALRKVAIVVQGNVLAYAEGSIRTGNLYGSINYKVHKDYAEVGTPVEYAPYVEYGTRKMEAQPYMRPGMDVSRSDAIKILRGEIDRELKRYGR